MTTADVPRILFQSVPDDLKPAFEGVPGLHSYVEGDEVVHPTDHDLLVTFEPSPHLDGNWHVLAFGISNFYADGQHFYLGKSDNYARAAIVSASVSDSENRSLIQRTILDEIAPTPRRIWHARIGSSQHRREVLTVGDLGGLVVPLVHLGQEKGVYAFLTQGLPKTAIWALPSETTDHRAWLIRVLETSHQIDPERFPGEPEWRKWATWAPADLQVATAARDAKVVERDRLVAEAEFQIAEADAAVDVERAVAEAGSWRLLTENDDALVHSVHAALEVFGFDVRELDEENRTRHGRRLEDLRVTVTGDPDWESLVEVKGYAKGAKVNDVRQVTGAPSIYFRMDHDREPRAVWHVVNVERGKDPSLRQPAIPNDADLQVLTDASGALIDTRDLFRALRDVESGVVTPADVRESLRSAVTRWSWPMR